MMETRWFFIYFFIEHFENHPHPAYRTPGRMTPPKNQEGKFEVVTLTLTGLRRCQVKPRNTCNLLVTENRHESPQISINPYQSPPSLHLIPT
jgi:hypothetical protein